MNKKLAQASTDAPNIPPRERILAAARELFYKHGIRAVGVEAIAEAAATNKMTLYRHFSSKDELIAAYLRALAKEGDDVWETLAREYPGDPNAQLDGWLRHVEHVITNTVDRGCAIANAAVELRESEHPARKIIDEYKTRKREKLVSLLEGSGYAEPQRLADEFFLLFEGARISIQCCASGPSVRVVAMMRSLLDRAPRAGKPTH
jgi:AcrR family transcriptional regulator